MFLVNLAIFGIFIMIAISLGSILLGLIGYLLAIIFGLVSIAVEKITNLFK